MLWVSCHDPFLSCTLIHVTRSVHGRGKFLHPRGKMFRPENHEDDNEDDDSSESEILSDDDDEDEEDDEEEERASQPPAKKRRTAASFFDEEAEASDNEDEDESGDEDPHDRVKKHYTEEDIRREQLDEEAQELIRQQDRRRAQAGGIRFGETSIADMAREIEDRHRMTSRRVERVEEEETYGDVSYTAVSQQSLVPSVSDPSLWMISCANGKEQELVYQIMNKCVAHARRGRPLGITSAIAAQSKGKIYIESYSEPAAVEAVQNIRGLLQYSMKLVPIQDMTTVMTVVSKKKPGKGAE